MYSFVLSPFSYPRPVSTYRNFKECPVRLWGRKLGVNFCQEEMYHNPPECSLKVPECNWILHVHNHRTHGCLTNPFIRPLLIHYTSGRYIGLDSNAQFHCLSGSNSKSVLLLYESKVTRPWTIQWLESYFLYRPD